MIPSTWMSFLKAIQFSTVLFSFLNLLLVHFLHLRTTTTTTTATTTITFKQMQLSLLQFISAAIFLWFFECEFRPWKTLFSPLAVLKSPLHPSTHSTVCQQETAERIVFLENLHSPQQSLCQLTSAERDRLLMPSPQHISEQIRALRHIGHQNSESQKFIPVHLSSNSTHSTQQQCLTKSPKWRDANMNFPQCETVPTTAATNSNSSSKENKLNSCYHQPVSNNRNLIQQKLSSPPSPVSSGVTQFEHKREVETKFCISTPPSKSIRSSIYNLIRLTLGLYRIINIIISKEWIGQTETNRRTTTSTNR